MESKRWREQQVFCWAACSVHLQVMAYPMFFASMFELADTWVESDDPDDHCDFLHGLTQPFQYAHANRAASDDPALLEGLPMNSV